MARVANVMVFLLVHIGVLLCFLCNACQGNGDCGFAPFLHVCTFNGIYGNFVDVFLCRKFRGSWVFGCGSRGLSNGPYAHLDVDRHVVIVLRFGAGGANRHVWLIISRPFRLPKDLVNAVGIVVEVVRAVDARRNFRAPLVGNFIVHGRQGPLCFEDGLLPCFQGGEDVNDVFLYRSVGANIPVRVMVQFKVGRTMRPINCLAVSRGGRPCAACTNAFVVYHLRICYYGVVRAFFHCASGNAAGGQCAGFFFPMRFPVFRASTTG